MDAAPGPVPNGPVKAIKGRVSPTSPTKKANRLEPQTPAKLATRAMPRSPSNSPYSSASREAAAVFSRASPYSPRVRASSPTTSSKSVEEIQDGRWCEPRRCSCCWASTKASGSGSPLQRLPGHLYGQDVGITVLLCGVGSFNRAQQGNMFSDMHLGLAKLLCRDGPCYQLACSAAYIKLNIADSSAHQLEPSVITMRTCLSCKTMCMHGQQLQNQL